MALVFIISELDDNWSLSSFNFKPNPVQCMWRRSRTLWNAILGAEPRELLDSHLQIRQRMIDDLGVATVMDDRGQQAYFERIIENHWQHRETLKKKNIILFYFEHYFYKIKPIYLWMGDFKKASKKHQAP